MSRSKSSLASQAQKRKGLLCTRKTSQKRQSWLLKRQGNAADQRGNWKPSLNTKSHSAYRCHQSDSLPSGSWNAPSHLRMVYLYQLRRKSCNMLLAALWRHHHAKPRFYTPELAALSSPKTYLISPEIVKHKTHFCLGAISTTHRHLKLPWRNWRWIHLRKRPDASAHSGLFDLGLERQFSFYYPCNSLWWCTTPQDQGFF